MYENVTNKMELERIICDNLKTHNIKCNNTDMFGHPVEMAPGVGIMEGFLNMPIENLRAMANVPIDICADFSQVYDKWGKQGVLKFQPYVLELPEIPHDTPSLVIRHNRYLHLFRKQYFQVSGTHSGVVSHGRGSFRVDFLNPWHPGQEVLTCSKLAYMLWWAAMLDVGFKYDNVSNLMNGNQHVLEDFLRDTLSRFDCGHYRWVDIEPFIKISAIGEIDYWNRKVYEIGTDKPIAYLAIGKKTIQAQSAYGTMVTLTIPNPTDGTRYDISRENDADEVAFQIGTLNAHHFREMLAVMALKLVGIHMDFTGSYKLSNDKLYLSHINAPKIRKIDNLDGIYEEDPDEF